MLIKPYGRSGLHVSALGLGAGQVGDERLSEAEAERLLNGALDAGITLIDTARGYGMSEERIGRHLSARRSEFVLSTKVGYGVEGHADWTPAIIQAGVERALRLMRTDCIDIVHLHSCDLHTLQHSGVAEALQRMRGQGKLRVAAYSGENEALAHAVDASAEGAGFGGVEASVNLFDQASLSAQLQRAHNMGLGVLAKRGLANAPWRFATEPHGDYAQVYWQRMHALAFDTAGLPWDELALRFTAYQAEVSSALVGTGSLAHLLHNVALVEKGPLDGDVVARLKARFVEVGAGFRGEI